MRVKMRTYYAGPAGSAQPGGLLTVSEEEGAALIAGNYAEAVETAAAPAPTSEPAAEEVAETATAPAPETATAPPSRPRGKRGR